MKFTELSIGQEFYFEGDPSKEENVKLAYGHYRDKKRHALKSKIKLKVLIPSSTNVIPIEKEKAHVILA